MKIRTMAYGKNSMVRSLIAAMSCVPFIAMAADEGERKLVAILAADVAGYVARW